MKTLLLSVALILAASPAVAQTADQYLLAAAAEYAKMQIDPKQVQPASSSQERVDARKDPWVPFTQEIAKATADQYARKGPYRLRAAVDYNNDGHIDVAQMYNNSKQSAVFIILGGPQQGAPILAALSDGNFAGGDQIVPAGRNRVLVSIDGGTPYLLMLINGRPGVVVVGND